MLRLGQGLRKVASERVFVPTARRNSRIRAGSSVFDSLDDLKGSVSAADMENSRWADSKLAAVNPKQAGNSQGLCVNSNFDSGNIDVVNMVDETNIQLNIHEDPYCKVAERAHYQWFYFRVTGGKGKALTLHLVNAGGASYPGGWDGYNACCSYDRVTWTRVPTSYSAETGELTIKHTPEGDSVYYAYFAPYTLEQHMDLISRCQRSSRVRLERLGATLDGHDIDLVILGDEAPQKKKVWLIARQHPGESMAAWFAQGALRRLTDRHDSEAARLLEDATVYVVPGMNLDGAWRGHLRTNACGINLNRAWAAPTIEESPEVFHVLSKMRQTGVDMFVDVHGDETIPNNFIAYAEGIPGWTDKMTAHKDKFSSLLKSTTPDFQTEQGYPEDKPGEANMAIACNAVAQEFDCFSLTLEQPFKDCASAPDAEFGWSSQRAERFGATFVAAIRQIVPDL